MVGVVATIDTVVDADLFSSRVHLVVEEVALAVVLAAGSADLVVEVGSVVAAAAPTGKRSWR